MVWIPGIPLGSPYERDCYDSNPKATTQIIDLPLKPCMTFSKRQTPNKAPTSSGILDIQTIREEVFQVCFGDPNTEPQQVFGCLGDKHNVLPQKSVKRTVLIVQAKGHLSVEGPGRQKISVFSWWKFVFFRSNDCLHKMLANYETIPSLKSTWK